MITSIITDIEGTTTDINFVHRVLFPYSRKEIAHYLSVNQNNPEILSIFNQVRQLMDNPQAGLADITNQLIQWIDDDVKIDPLKKIQGNIWQYGFEQGEYQGHLYPDAFENLLKWHQQKINLYVYSSGSVKAQQLLFQYSLFGDIRFLFAGNFDLKIGGKKEAQSYAKILQEINLDAAATLFLSDVVSELDAARENGIKTILLNRNNETMVNNGHQECQSFNEINLTELL